MDFATADGTATGGAACGTPGVDYVSVAQRVTFGFGEYTKTVNVQLCADSLAEPTESIILRLTPESIGGSPHTAFLNIIDTPPTPTVTPTVVPACAPRTFSNTAAIAINDNASGSPYPSNITVSGLPGVVTKVTASLVGVSHTFPDNIDVMLVSPSGENTLLMSDSGGSHAITNVGLQFDDAVPLALPDETLISGGTFEPTNYDTDTDVFPAPAPALGIPVAMGVFIGANPNGVWSLYVRDDLAPDEGTVSGGWTLTITTADPSCASPTASISGRVTTASGQGIRNAKVVVTGGLLAEPVITSTGSFGYFRFDGFATGQTYVVSVYSKRYTFATPSRVITLLDNVVDADFVSDPQ